QLYLAFISEFMGRLRWLEWPGDAAQLDPATRRTFDVAALIRDPRFEDHLATRLISARDLARQYQDLAEQAERVLARIEARLAKVGVSIPPPTPRPDCPVAGRRALDCTRRRQATRRQLDRQAYGQRGDRGRRPRCRHRV